MDSLAQLHAEMRACRRCLDAGHAIAPGAVFSAGAEKRALLIGQAPGVTEAEVKRPFNAGSGKRLFQWLAAAGWEEEDFRARHTMTAVTKCYPGKDRSGKGDRVPSRAEQALCRAFLEREITLVRPQLILLVGGLAIKLFFPKNAKLVDVIGTAVYYPPEALEPPLTFDLAPARRLTLADVQTGLAQLSPVGRLLVPLPHPSGASLWPNKPANKRRIDTAVAILSLVRQQWQL